MTIVRVQFDGRVLVPTEPVDLPRDRVLEVHVHDIAEQPAHRARANGQRGGLPVFDVPAAAPIITSEDVRRGEDEP